MPHNTMSRASEAVISFRPRHHRWFVDPGVDWTEANTGPAWLDWQLPAGRLALVLIGVWDKHYLSDAQQRNERVVMDVLVPLSAACRAAGVQVIHAPAPGLAEQEPAWVGKGMTVDRPLPAPVDPAWPPADFRRKQGNWASLARPAEPRQAEQDARRLTYVIHPAMRPKPGDVVIRDGNELHQYCKEQGIVTLLFAGFHINACLVQRDYGVLAMMYRGYDTVIVRDATTAMENADTQPDLRQHREALLMFEMFGSHSVASADLIQSLTQASASNNAATTPAPGTTPGIAPGT